MTLRIPEYSIAIDPLIAEAKRRTRRRRAWVVAAIVAVVALAALLTSGLEIRGGSTSIPSDGQPLRNAVALGTLVGLDRRTGVAEFRISCGSHKTTRGERTGKLRPGLFSVPLQGFRFTVTHSWRDVGLSTWERHAERSVGTGAFYVATGPSNLEKPLITDSDTTVCHGVLGYPGPI